MSGIVGSKLNIRGSGPVSKLGTDGQHLLSSGAGKTASFEDAAGGTTYSGVQTSGFTAVSGNGYPCNTTSSAFTVTLPASPSVGDNVTIVDYGQTFASNNVTVGRNSEKINGVAADHLLVQSRMSITFVYTDSTKGWLPTATANATSSSNTGNYSTDTPSYTLAFLAIGGGGGGGGGVGGGGGGAGGYRNSYASEASGRDSANESDISFKAGITYTVTIGGGGGDNTTGVNSTIAGTGFTTFTALGGGKGKGGSDSDGGSGGGSSGTQATAGGSGTAAQGYDGGSCNSGSYRGGGGGGGATENGDNGVADSAAGVGGDGLASSITTASVTRAGGGGGGAQVHGSTSAGAGGSGGGGAGNRSSSATAGTANTGSGGGSNQDTGATGGSGFIVLRMLTANYSGTVTGSPTVTTSGDDTIIQFTGSGTIVG